MGRGFSGVRIPGRETFNCVVAGEIVVNVFFGVTCTYFRSVIVFLNSKKRFYVVYFDFSAKLLI